MRTKQELLGKVQQKESFREMLVRRSQEVSLQGIRSILLLNIASFPVIV